MRPHFTVFAALLALATSSFAAGQAPLDSVRAAIVAAVSERLGAAATAIDVEIVQAPATVAEAQTAAPVTGGRLGQPVRFTITPTDGRPFAVVARVTASLTHVVATRAVARDAALTADDVEERRGPVDHVLIEPLPALSEVLSARARRAIAGGEVVNRAALSQPFAVRAGDTVAMTMRTGVIEVRGVGRAVSSGYIGDVIRILPPGTRQPSRARVTAPATVEILR